MQANPHKRLRQLYGPRMMAQYRGVPLGELSPHVYAIAEQVRQEPGQLPLPRLYETASAPLNVFQTFEPYCALTSSTIIAATPPPACLPACRRMPQ